MQYDGGFVLVEKFVVFVGFCVGVEYEVVFVEVFQQYYVYVWQFGFVYGGECYGVGIVWFGGFCFC